MKKIIVSLTLLSCTLMTLPLQAHKEIIIAEQTTNYVVVQQAPPADIVEVQDTKPGPEYSWIKGHWKWENNKWAWHKGGWTLLPHPEAQWVVGYWQKKHHGWIWVEGHWE
jgi:WXXGXW repeat (2 copies)